MEITNWTRQVERNTYVGVISGSKTTKESGKPPVHNTDTVVISEDARRAAIAAEMEQDGINRAASGEMAFGKFTVTEPNWDSFEVRILEGQADPNIYKTAYMEAYLKELGALTQDVQSHYAPEFAEIKDMDTVDAMNYLFKTYKQPWMKDVFLPGTSIPLPPNGMSQGAANMAYDQLKSMYAGNGISVLRDPYALGADGMERLNNIEKHAHEAAQTVYDVAQKEYEAQQEIGKAEQLEKAKRMYQSLSSGTSTHMGSMALRSKAEDEASDKGLDSQGREKHLPQP